jgi:glycosyltransferase involved in cell wall biosynthesis
VVRAAAAVTTDSEHSRKDILAAFPGVRAPVVLNPVAESFRPSADDVPLPEALGSRPYVLCLGAADPRKNTPLTVETFLGAVGRLPPDLCLVVAGMGAPSPAVERVLALHPGTRDRVIFPGFVPEAVLSSLYRRARALLYLSRFEGFGMPLLDAMHHDCPVVCARATSLPEVAGDAALLVDPGDAPAIADALVAVSTDADLRAGLRDKGRIRREAFSWRSSAQRMLDVYASCAGK